MKKLLLTLLITLSSLVSFSQEPLMGTAYLYQIGIVNQYTHKIDWIGEPSKTNIPVQFNNKEIIVFSQGHQVYQIIKVMGTENKTTMWEAMDKKGTTCWVYISDLDDLALMLTIQYKDYAWMYVCYENK